MSLDRVIELVQNDNLSDEAWVKELQRHLYSLNPNKYNKNYNYCKSRFPDGGDGDFGPKTCTDIITFLQDYPDTLLDLGPKVTQHLCDHGYTQALQNIARSDTSLQDNLRGEIDCILDGKELTDLTKDELKLVQTNWKLLGEYTGRIDGLNGPKTREALRKHKHVGCEDNIGYRAPENESRPAPSHRVSLTPCGPPDIRGSFGDCSSRMGVNGDYGIPLHHIQAAQEAAQSGNVYKGFTPAPGQKVVVIDFGHNTEYYGRRRQTLNDKGAHSDYTGQSETDFIDPVARDLAERYYQQGYVVAFTRNPGEKMQMHHETSLGYRARIAAGLGADVFISLHADGAASPSQNGGAVYCQSGTLTNNDRNFRHQIAQNMDIHGRGKPASEMRGNFQVLRDFRRLGKPDAACVLLEPGYLTNRRDALALEQVSRNPGSFTQSIVNATDDHIASIDPNHRGYLAQVVLSGHPQRI